MNNINAIHVPQVVPCPESVALGGNYVPCAKTNRKAVLLITILGSSLAFMDGSIVNVALPTLQKAFQASASAVQWVVQSYALFCAALLLFSGVLGDRFGRKKIFTIGVIFFTISSLGAAVAGSLVSLIAWRSLQGIGASFLIPQSLAILSAAYSSEERAAAIGAWSAWTSVFAAIGPVIGGWLIQILNWRWAFVINLPVALWIVILLPRLRESEAELSLKSIQKLDLKGTALNTFGLAALVYALSFASQLGWLNRSILWSLVIGMILIGLFFWTQAHNENALMPLSLFDSPRFLAVNLLTFLFYGALGGVFYVVPFFAIQIKHLSPIATGAAFLPCIAIMFLFASRIGQLSSRYGERPFLIAGAVASSIGLALFGMFAKQPGYATALLPGMLGLGVGITIMLAPLTNVVMSSVPVEKTGVASAVNNSVSRLAGLLILSAWILVLAGRFERDLRVELDRSGLSRQTIDSLYAQRALMTAIQVPTGLPFRDSQTAQKAIENAYTNGYAIVMYCCAAVALLSALPVFIWWDKERIKGHVSKSTRALSIEKGQQLA